MEININGKALETNSTTLSELIMELGVSSDGLAVAVGQRVISRSDWDLFKLEGNENIVLINATRGG